MSTSEEEEYFSVAADFTLYSNPLVKALHVAPTETVPEKKTEKVVDDVIASDMTAYDSPMTSLDRRTVERTQQNEAKKSPFLKPKHDRGGKTEKDKKQKDKK